MKQIKQAAFLLVAAGIVLTGCGSSGNPQAASTPTGGTSAQSPSATESVNSAEPTVQLAWSRIGTFFGDPQVRYVARVTNHASSPVSATLDVRVLDSTGTIVGSSQETVPDIPASSDFDFFGYVGGGAGPAISGTPAKTEVSLAGGTFDSGAMPLLRTSEVTLASGDSDTNTDMTHSYDLTAKVTNSTGQPLSTGFTEQAVLYNQAGQIVGGDTATPDNAPADLPAGVSYRADWGGIAAAQTATRVAYSVWPLG